MSIGDFKNNTDWKFNRNSDFSAIVRQLGEGMNLEYRYSIYNFAIGKIIG